MQFDDDADDYGGDSNNDTYGYNTIQYVPPPVCVLDVFKILYFIIIMIIYTARFDLFSLSNAHEMNIIYTYTYA